MGGALSSSANDEAAKARNDEIEARLLKDQLRARTEIRILLFGTDDAAKTALLTLARASVGTGDSPTTIQHKLSVFSYLVRSMRIILEALPTLPSVNDAYRATILAQPAHIEAEVFPPEVADAIRHLWRDPSVQEAARNAEELHLDNGIADLFDGIDRIAELGYTPTDRDILTSRTASLMETSLRVDELTYKLIDVGEHRSSDRMKWMSYFDGVNAIVFFANIAEYGEGVTGLKQSLDLFDSACNSPWFENTCIILFLSGTSQLEERLRLTPFSTYFPDYTGDSAHFDDVCDYILKRFVSLNRNAKRQIYAHYANPLDDMQVRFILSAIQDILLQDYLREQDLQ
ncbi:heterotrimeric G protein alpha subunit B [Mycena amicta]|nr:heterotrimeric G protein alpha subunit B [Mycena amicta]